MALDSVHELAKTIPESVYMTYQMTFAIITPALIAGAFAERMKFSAMMWFMGLWAIFVYAPVAHWVWGGGFLGDWGVLDYAGGTVVHINAGVAGLVCALVEDHRNPLMSLSFAFHGGASLDPVGKEGLALLTTGLLDEGEEEKHGLSYHPPPSSACQNGPGTVTPQRQAHGCSMVTRRRVFWSAYSAPM